MRWQKLGNIFSPDNNFPWMVSHAANPFAETIDKDIIKIYFTCRDRENRSHIAYVIININNPFSIIELSSNPVLEPGELGLFDDSGVTMGYLMKINGKRHLYYLGWNLKVTVPWFNAIGLAIEDKEDSGVFIKYTHAPVMDRSKEDPFSLSYPAICFHEGVYKMWYGSCMGWENLKHPMKYVIKNAISNDGINWFREDTIAINFKHPGEYAIAKPFVLKGKNGFRMWYSFRGNKNIDTYRIGFASSKDGSKWDRMDDLSGIDVSDSGWDSEMIEYPFVFIHNDSTYMLYNGNGYGKTGFGLAILVED